MILDEHFDPEAEVEQVFRAVAEHTRDLAARAAEEGRDLLASVLRAAADDLDRARADA